MATSSLKNEQYTPEEFVESAGAILFHLSKRQVCVLHLLSRDEYFLPKGRRNYGESRQQAALREVREETGYECRLIPIRMSSRAPPDNENHADVPRVYENSTEPFYLQVRHLSKTKTNVKLIWWYVAGVDEDKEVHERHLVEHKFEVKFYSFEEVLQKLTFQNDRDIVAKAIIAVEASYHPQEL